MVSEVLKPRSARLVRVLLERKGPIVVECLAKQFSVSPRTIRYDLASVKEWVEPRGMSLITQPRIGVRLTGNPERVLRDLARAQKPSYQAPLLVGDRQKAILLALLQVTSPISLATLAEALYVSRSTVKSDVSTLKDQVRRHGIFLRNKPGVGHYIEGDEMVIRRALAKLYFEKVDNRLEMVPWADLVPGVRVITKKELDCVWQTTGFFWVETRLCLDHDAFSRFAAMVAISLVRVSLDKHITMDPDRLQRLAKTREYGAIKRLIKKLKETTGIEMKSEDIAFLVIYLMEMGLALEPDTKGVIDRDLAEECADALISHAQDRLGVELVSDIELKAGLSGHIQRVSRFRDLGIRVQNPLLDEMKKRFPKVFEACLEGLSLIREKTGQSLEQSEVGYLAMHIAAALERKHERPKKVLVCTHGQSSGELLSARLLANFRDLEIVDIVPTSRIMQYEKLDEIDFVVSSVPIKLSKEIVVVSPLMTEDDMRILETKGFSKVRHTKPSQTSRRLLAEKILRTVEEHVRVVDPEALLEAIDDVLRYDTEGDTSQPDVRKLASRMAQKFRRDLKEKFGSQSVAELRSRFSIGLERVLSGVKLTRRYLEPVIRKFPKEFALVERLLSEATNKINRGFSAEECAYLTACVVSPTDISVMAAEIALLASHNLDLNSAQVETLEKLVWAAHEGAYYQGISLDRGTLLDLALHLGSTVIKGQETSVLREMASHAALELRPEMIKAGQSMAERMSDILDRDMEPWEETYLSLYAGSAVLSNKVANIGEMITKGTLAAKN